MCKVLPKQDLILRSCLFHFENDNYYCEYRLPLQALSSKHKLVTSVLVHCTPIIIRGATIEHIHYAIISHFNKINKPFNSAAQFNYSLCRHLQSHYKKITTRGHKNIIQPLTRNMCRSCRDRGGPGPPEKLQKYRIP